MSKLINYLNECIETDADEITIEEDHLPDLTFTEVCIIIRLIERGAKIELSEEAVGTDILTDIENNREIFLNKGMTEELAIVIALYIFRAYVVEPIYMYHPKGDAYPNAYLGHKMSPKFIEAAIMVGVIGCRTFANIVSSLNIEYKLDMSQSDEFIQNYFHGSTKSARK